ncbi:MAG: type I glyceraldehyde-3-phosphate dehydrogenase [Myxococcales bacterium]|nr:type I glyceraldehyde-3-phosphate dehydrogenase [Myxococcales bacterium]
MAVRIAINGFGRIGRNVLRAGWGKPEFEFVHINDLTSADMLAYLLRRDSVHGTFPHDVKAVDGGISIDGEVIPVTAEKDPSKLPWGASNVDVVFECTGVFTNRAALQQHRDAGARKVVLSAPAKNEAEVDLTIVMGVNDGDYDGEKHHIVSNASCTTNCLAPLVKALHGAVGIEHGLVTTIHSYTMDQNLLDAPHRKGDFRRARAAAANMVPSSTGAAKAIGLVMPELKGKLNGMSMRVPTTDVSIVDLVFQASRETSKEEINDILSKAAAGPLKGVLGATDEPIVSSDMVGNPNSSIVDLPLTQVMAGNMVKVFSWYDNEWGFSCRMLDLAKRIAG